MKRSVLRKKSKSERKYLIDFNDKIFRELLLRRDKVCQYTGKPGNLQVSHYISRENLHLRWSFENCCIINGGIHIFTFHKRHHLYRNFMCQRIGEDKVKWLEMQDTTYCRPLYTYDLRLIKQQLLKKLESL